MRDYGVYVIEIDGDAKHVYVGQTSHTPDKRLAQHNTGLASNFAAKVFKRGSRGVLRQELYGHIARVSGQAEAEKLEAKLAKELEKKGFKVEGGH